MRLSGRLALYTVTAACALTGVLALIDHLYTNEPILTWELAPDFVEMLVLTSAMVAISIVVGRLRGLEDATLTMKRELSQAAEAGREWRAQSERLFQGLSAAVAAQFDAWGLTSAEAEVASLMLKGLSLKDIAQLREKSEGTIRQQAQSIYRKSGLNNRTELSAYFLEDLFDVATAKAALSEMTDAKH